MHPPPCITHLVLSLGDEKLIFGTPGDAAAPSRALEGIAAQPTQGAKTPGVSLVKQQTPPLFHPCVPLQVGILLWE